MQKKAVKAVPDNVRSISLFCDDDGPQRILGDDTAIRLFTSDLSRAGRHPTVEYRNYGQHRVRPDIKALDTHGGADFYDFTFVIPLAPSYIGRLRQRPIAALNRASYQKFVRFHAFISSTNNCRLILVPILALGGGDMRIFQSALES